MITIGKATVEQTSDKERKITLNGINFFVGLTGKGRRILTACDESKAKLKSAAAFLESKGYDCTVKKSDDPHFFVLKAQERDTEGEKKWSQQADLTI